MFEQIRRVPEITDEQIAAMRRIVPCILQEDGMYKEIEDADKIDARRVSFLWNAEVHGEPFTFTNMATIITQHYSAYFFKPSLAEVYAWILFAFPQNWDKITHFCLGEPRRISGTVDCVCECMVADGPKLVRGEPVVFANGHIGYELVPQSEEGRAKKQAP